MDLTAIVVSLALNTAPSASGDLSLNRSSSGELGYRTQIHLLLPASEAFQVRLDGVLAGTRTDPFNSVEGSVSLTTAALSVRLGVKHLGRDTSLFGAADVQLSTRLKLSLAYVDPLNANGASLGIGLRWTQAHWWLEGSVKTDGSGSISVGFSTP